MTYIILLFIIFLIIIFSYLIFKKDILSPTIVFSTSFFFAIMCAFLGLNSWNDVNELHEQTIFVIIYGIFITFFVEIIFRLFFKRKAEKDINMSFIKISKFKMILIILYILTSSLLYILEIKRIARGLGYHGNSISDMLYLYRTTSTVFTTKYIGTNLTINVFVAQMKKLQDVIAYVFIYIFINNFVIDGRRIFYTKKLSCTFLYILIIMLCAILSLISGGRAKLMSFIIGALFIYMQLYKRYNNHQINFQIIKKIGKIAILSLILFYFSSSLIGRKAKTDFSGYITFYFGTSITCLDKYFEYDYEPSKYFGQETLFGVNDILYDLKIIDEMQTLSYKWYNYNVNGTSLNSNIFTSFRRYYQDFGYLGILFFQSIFIVTMLLLYYKSNTSKNYLYIIFYSMYFYALIDHVRDEIFYRHFIHVNMIFNIILLILIDFFLFHVFFKNNNVYFRKKEKDLL